MDIQKEIDNIVETAYQKNQQKIREAEELISKVLNGGTINKTELRKVIAFQKQCAKSVAYFLSMNTELAKVWANRGSKAGNAISLTVARI